MIIFRLIAFFLGLVLIIGGGACLWNDMASLFSSHGQDFMGFLIIGGVGVGVVIGGWKLFQYGRYRD